MVFRKGGARDLSVGFPPRRADGVAILCTDPARLDEIAAAEQATQVFGRPAG